MAAVSIFVATMGQTSPTVGKVMDRYGIRSIMASGAALMGCGFVAVSLVRSPTSSYGAYVLVGCGGAAVLSWSDRRRDGALGIISARLPAGGVVMAPFIGAVLVPHMGWRNAYQALALITWLLTPAVLLILKDGARGMDRRRDDAAPANAGQAQKLVSGLEQFSLGTALGGATFWLVAVSFMASGFSQLGAIDEHPLDGQKGGLCRRLATV